MLKNEAPLCWAVWKMLDPGCCCCWIGLGWMFKKLGGACDWLGWGKLNIDVEGGTVVVVVVYISVVFEGCFVGVNGVGVGNGRTVVM